MFKFHGQRVVYKGVLNTLQFAFVLFGENVVQHRVLSFNVLRRFQL